MQPVPSPAWWLLAAMSACTFVVTILDKVRARRGGARIRERTLLGLALLGGSPGLLVAMLVSHHKVRKTSFLTRFWLVLAIQLLLVAAWIYWP